MESLKDRLRRLRAEKKVDQIDVARYLNCSVSTVSGYETGKTAPVEIQIKLAHYYDVSTDYLLCLTNERKPAGGSLNLALTSLAQLAGEHALTASELAALAEAAARYYRKGAPCGAIPMQALNAFIAGMTTALDAAATDNTAALIDGANAAAVAALDASRMVGEYYTRQDAVIFPVAAHGGGVSSTAATPDSAADQTLRERPSDTID